MTQVSKRQLDPTTQQRIYEIFTQIVSDARDPNDVHALLEDFFTPTERIMLPKRLCIAYLLLKKYDQRTIASYLKVSHTTINRVSTSLKLGGKGYRTMLARIGQHKQFEHILTTIEEGILTILASGSGKSRAWKTLKRAHAQEKNSQSPF